ncbi:MAG: glycosyltransferase family 39 protein [Bacteroidales bacterium]|nr:glycosyltransferase family 39 protein [Bacteroidales bacterium]
MRLKPIHILLLASLLIRSLLAGWIELGNDEAYYWTYALFPDWSHYDHPGMVGWVMQLFSLNLLFDSEFFLRLGSLVFMTLNTWLVYRIGLELKDERTGLLAALLYTASVYAFVITGVFILPDTPLNLFWLLAFRRLLRYVRDTAPQAATAPRHPRDWRKPSKHLLLAGLYIGLSILSKYSGAFLWVGFLAYLLLHDRKQFKNPYLYLAALLTALCCLPILWWNLQNDFISFRFHGERVGFFGTLTPGNFFKELGGEVLYNNPVNVGVALLAAIAAFRRKLPLERPAQRLLLLTALPMIGLFLLVSLTRPTLPHWSGPAYNLLVLLSAVWLTTRSPKRQRRWITASLAVLALILVVGVAEIKTGFIPLDRHEEPQRIGKDDISLDLYGWRQAGEKFAAFRTQEIAEGRMHEGDAIIGNSWFPTASIDYYIARPLGLKVLGYGPLERIHKYQWINEERGGFTKKADYWYLADSHYFIDPEKAYAYVNFKNIELAGVIPIERNGKVVRNLLVYECKSLVYGPPTLEEIRTNH